jgi:hypothetical protein
LSKIYPSHNLNTVAVQEIAVEMDFAPLEDVSATLTIMAQTVKIVNLSISWTVATFAHSTKVPAI